MNDLLLIIDLQAGFINDKNRHIIRKIVYLNRMFLGKNKKVAFTRFINYKDSPYVNFINWSRMFKGSKESELVPEFQQHSNIIFDKAGYSALTESTKSYLSDNKVSRLFLCGLETDSCILKTAFDAFESNINCYIIEDACFSKDIDFHHAGLMIISRNIGSNHIIETKEIEEML